MARVSYNSAPRQSVSLTSRLTFDAIRTSWELGTPTPLAAATRASILDLVERFDSIYSRFRHDSIVMRIANAVSGGTFSCPADAVPMFELYDRLYGATNGAVDPLVGRDLELLGYDCDYRLTPDDATIAATVAQRPVWCRDVQRQANSLTTRRPLVIDVGAVGKGPKVSSASVSTKSRLASWRVPAAHPRASTMQSDTSGRRPHSNDRHGSRRRMWRA